MDAFWGITISLLLIRAAWKSNWLRRKPRRVELPPTPIDASALDKEFKSEAQKKEVEKRREKEIEELKKQGYTDELIAVIIPTINNGQ